MVTPLLKLMIDTAEKSAEIVRRNFRQTTEYQDKTSHLDIVTATDLESQTIIHRALLAGAQELGWSIESVGFVEEESTQDSLQHHNFIVDPIDGTSNFASGIPYSCISIGYAEGQELKAGVVIDPFSGTVFWAEVGQGAFAKNASRGQWSLALQSKPIKSWMVSAHLNSLEVVDHQFEQYQKLYPHIRGMRNLGSLTLDLCHQADNVFDVVMNQSCFLWDLAAARVILREAGGEIFDLSGKPLEFLWQETKHKYSLLACHPDVLSQLQTVID